jgi:hypothetical protein
VEGRFVEEDVLYRRTLCIGGRFVEGWSVEGRFVERTFCSEGRFVEGRFVLAPLKGLSYLIRFVQNWYS